MKLKIFSYETHKCFIHHRYTNESLVVVAVIGNNGIPAIHRVTTRRPTHQNIVVCDVREGFLLSNYNEFGSNGVLWTFCNLKYSVVVNF